MFNNAIQHVEKPTHEQEEIHINEPLLPVIEDTIADRFVRSHEIRLMSELPNISDQLKVVTIITPNGLFQLNQETNTLKCLLDTDKLTQLGLADFLAYAECCISEEGTLIQDALTLNSITLEQLRTLERTIVNVGSHGVIGYTFNERVWIKFIGHLLCEQYPPKPDNYSRRCLKIIHYPIIKDVLLSSKVGLFLLGLFEGLGSWFFQEDTIHNSTFYDFQKRNIQWIVLCVGIFIALNILLLRGNYFSKSIISAGLNRIQRIERYMMAFLKIISSETLSWMLSKTFASPGTPIAIYLTIPLLMLAIKLGLNDNDDSVLNIFHHPRRDTFFNAFRYALMTSSFCSLGILLLIFDSLHLEQKHVDDDYPLRPKAYKIQAIIQFIIFIITMMEHLMRYPYAPQPLQTIGKYMSNVSNAIGNVFLSTFAISVIEYSLVDFFSAMLHQSLAWSKPWSQPVFISLQFVIFLCAFMVEFPTTPNLPELSIEPIPPEKIWCEIIIERIQPITQCFRRSRDVIASNQMWDFFSAKQVQATDTPMINPIQAEKNETNEAILKI